jgi:hypothetical protein
MKADPPKKNKGTNPKVYCPNCSTESALSDIQVAALRKQLAELPERPEESDPV